MTDNGVHNLSCSGPKADCGPDGFTFLAINGKAQDTLTARVRIQADAAWFEGHFPGSPLLPGIAHLALVFEIIRRMNPVPLRLKAFRRIRFRQMIKPGDEIDIRAVFRGEDPISYAFTIRVHDTDASSGVIVLAPIEGSDNI